MPFGEQPVKGTKSATLSVGASDTQDVAGCDYVCDGTCDEVEINQAIAALPAQGGLVYLCEGTFNVCGPIIIDKDNITIIGAGASTVIRITDNHNANLNVIEATNFDNILIKDLRIDGNTANQTAGVMNGIYFDTVTHSKVMGCWGENLRNNGIHLDSSDYNTITGDTCQGNDNGIGLSSSSDNTVTGNTCQGNGASGIYLMDASDYNTVTGNTCRGNTENGIHLVASSNNTFTGNTCRGNTENGIYLTTLNNNTFAGNTVQGNGYHGIYLVNSDHNEIADNEVVNNGLFADVTLDGIHLETSDYNNIQGNTVRTTVAAPPPNRQQYGINISNAACDGNLVKGNDLHQSGQTGAFQDLGTDTKLPELWVNSIFDDSDANVTLSNIGDHVSLELADGVDTSVRFNFRVPSDFHQVVRACVVVVPLGTGDLAWSADTDWGRCTTEIYNNGSDTTGPMVTGVVINRVECLNINAPPTSCFDGITAGGHVGVAFGRNASIPSDTVGAAVHLLQFWMQYV